MFIFSKPDGKDFSDDVSVCISPLLLPHIFTVSKDRSRLRVCRWLQRWPMLLLPQELPGAFPASSRKRCHPNTPPLTLRTSWSLAAFANNMPANHRLDLMLKRLCLLRLASGACVKLRRANSRAQWLVAMWWVVKGGCRYHLPFLPSDWAVYHLWNVPGLQRSKVKAKQQLHIQHHVCLNHMGSAQKSWKFIVLLHQKKTTPPPAIQPLRPNRFEENTYFLAPSQLFFTRPCGAAWKQLHFPPSKQSHSSASSH